MNKYLYVFLILIAFGVSCENEDSEPNYPHEPFIESGTIGFIKGQYSTDTLKLTFKLRDGDFDLGLSPLETDSPYHYLNFFSEDIGNLEPVVTKLLDFNLLIKPNASQTGKLATYRRLLNSSLNPPPVSCFDYYYFEAVYLSTEHNSFIDHTFNITDTLTKSSVEVYALRDTFLVEDNPNYYNILVDYFVEGSDGTFSVFDWKKLICQSFNGRIPLLVGEWSVPIIKNGPFKIKRISKQRCEFVYSMQSSGFKNLFGGKRIKLRFSIKDRALNQSNITETEPILIPK